MAADDHKLNLVLICSHVMPGTQDGSRVLIGDLIRCLHDRGYEMRYLHFWRSGVVRISGDGEIYHGAVRQAGPRFFCHWR